VTSSQQVIIGTGILGTSNDILLIKLDTNDLSKNPNLRPHFMRKLGDCQASNFAFITSDSRFEIVERTEIDFKSSQSQKEPAVTV
jgi:hypothetical protein